MNDIRNVLPNNPLIRNGFVQLIKVGNSIRHTWVKNDAIVGALRVKGITGSLIRTERYYGKV